MKNIKLALLITPLFFMGCHPEVTTDSMVGKINVIHEREFAGKGGPSTTLWNSSGKYPGIKNGEIYYSRSSILEVKKVDFIERYYYEDGKKSATVLSSDPKSFDVIVEANADVMANHDFLKSVGYLAANVKYGSSYVMYDDERLYDHFLKERREFQEDEPEQAKSQMVKFSIVNNASGRTLKFSMFSPTKPRLNCEIRISGAGAIVSIDAKPF